MSPFSLSAKETAQFMRKLADKKLGSRFHRQQVVTGEHTTDAYDRQQERGISSQAKPPRMPADSHREECRCGIVMKFSSTDEAFANKFIAIWWKRHSGVGHGKVK